MPDALERDPGDDRDAAGDLQRFSDSHRSSTAKRTAKNGWRFANSDARDGPTRSIAVNQRMFVRKSGPITA